MHTSAPGVTRIAWIREPGGGDAQWSCGKMFWSFCAAVTRGSVEYDAGLPDAGVVSGVGLPDAGVDEPHVAVEVCVLFSCPESWSRAVSPG